MNSHHEKIENHFAKIASLIGEKTRAVMLWNLLDGRAYTATELADCAGISKQACSNHLLQLCDSGILTMQKQGRHRYFTFANDKAAQAVENIASLMPEINTHDHMNSDSPAGIKYARTCYDHLAGKVAVEILNGLVSNGWVISQGESFNVTSDGEILFKRIGINTSEVSERKRKFAFPCMDWSERRAHLGGALGASLLEEFLKKDWIRKTKYSREVILTPPGKMKLMDLLKISL